MENKKSDRFVRVNTDKSMDIKQIYSETAPPTIPVNWQILPYSGVEAIENANVSEKEKC